MKTRMNRLGLAFVCLFFTANLSADELSVPEFSKWKLHGQARILENDILEVTGKGDVSRGMSEELKFKKGACYRFSLALRSTDSSGACLPCGLDAFHRDYQASRGDWSEQSFCFRVQENLQSQPIRLGQWESHGTFQFKNVKLEEVVPVFRCVSLPLKSGNANLLLGEGESLHENRYIYNGWFNGEGTNVSRCLFASNANFNSNRWCFGENSYVAFRFAVEPEIAGEIQTIPLHEVKIRLNFCYFAGGEAVVEISKTGTDGWFELGRIKEVASAEFTVPKIATPLETLYLRVRAEPKSNFQLDSVRLESTLLQEFLAPESNAIHADGETLFASFRDGDPASTQTEQLSLTSDFRVRVKEFDESGNAKERFIDLDRSPSPGEQVQEFTVANREYKLVTQTHPLQREDYGKRVLAIGFGDKTAFKLDTWWCEADWKVSQDRKPPSGPDLPGAPSISAAKNDRESFQLVLRPRGKQEIKGLEISASSLKLSETPDGFGHPVGIDGPEIPKENIQIRYAYYHHVHSKTDGSGLIGNWPDALPPLEEPIDLEPGKNLPIWITVTVPEDAVPGTYIGALSLSMSDSSSRAPERILFQVKVWDFALPRENHLATAYGYSPWLAGRYHNAKTDEERRKVHELYLQCFAEHRISPYNPVPFDEIGVKWFPNENPPRCELDFTRFDAELQRVLEKYRFTNLRLPVHGLGGGTFHSRNPGSIAGFAEDTPQYKAMMRDYLEKLQTHLKEKNWHEKVYVYWFDEPDPKDYDFVSEGFAKLSSGAPELPRMLTEEPNEGMIAALEKAGTSVNIWCPVSHCFDSEAAAKRISEGERFWWYVCTGPKSPYCTLFIDHPATELRVWHWQAWQRGIVGSLVWESNYWTSDAAFPEQPQDPYEDPMGYVSGYSTLKGAKLHWGNGDGRFIYPPLSASVPGKNGGRVVYDKPVSSIRWEMIREGVEDYEMLYLLRELTEELRAKDKLSEQEYENARKLLQVPPEITKSMTEFTLDPRPLLRHRTKIAEMIELLQKKR